MQLPTSLASDYSKAAALDMSNHYYNSEPTKYPPSTGDSNPYSMSTLPTGDNAGIVAQAQAAGMFSRFPIYDRLDIPKPGYEAENLSTTEAFMRSYSTTSSNGSCANPYSPQDRLHAPVHQQNTRAIPPGAYPSPQVMSNTNPAGVPIFPWMRSNISGK